MSVLLEVSLRETEPIGTYPLERVHIERDCLAFWGRVLAAPGVVELEERDGATEFQADTENHDHQREPNRSADP
jgi:hypothetical protein